MSELQVLHFGQQCPWLPWVVEQARLAAAELGATLTTVDVTLSAEAANEYQLFFPFLTIIDGATRIAAPTPAARLSAYAREPQVSLETLRPAEPAKPTVAAVPDRIEPLTPANSGDSCLLCGAPNSCTGKRDWLLAQAEQSGASSGYVAYSGGQPVAALELLPATAVPYPLPVPRDGAAFLACVYPTANPDYRGALLDHLRTALPPLGYGRVLVVAGRWTNFPNGPADFLAAHGFRELRPLGRERLRDTYDELVLMELLL
jgi:hypothetical protein